MNSNQQGYRMLFFRRFLTVCSIAGIVNCGVGSNLEPQTRRIAAPDEPEAIAPEKFSFEREDFLDELAFEQWVEVCEWMVEIQGGPKSVDCGDGITVTVDTVEDCSTREDFPHCQVGQLMDCVREQSQNLCGNAPVSCTTFYACVYGESS